MTETATDPAVRLIGLGRRFGQHQAVRDVSLDIGRGELICLLGSSGSGKTTLLRLIAGFDVPTEGMIELDGRGVEHLAPSKRSIGMVFQNYALFPTMTVRTNIEYGLRMRGWSRARRRARSDEMLERMRLAAFADRLPRQLSGGQQQRVAIARALAYSPQLLLMDEPLGALDKALKQEMLAEIQEVHREFGATILYVTHDREEALVLADRVAIMRNARIVACQPVEELYLSPVSAYAAMFFGGANLLPVSSDEQGTRIGSSRDRLPLEMASGRRLAAIRPRDVSLGDGPEPGWRIEGAVRRVAFLGDDVRVTVEHADGRLEALLPQRLGRLVMRGDRVTCRLPVQAVRVVLDDLDEHAGS